MLEVITLPERQLEAVLSIKDDVFPQPPHPACTAVGALAAGPSKGRGSTLARPCPGAEPPLHTLIGQRRKTGNRKVADS
ncbi:hypothetical protein [Pseudoxanthomonas sp. X-1]|uniref:hypothetical protein n=1 Tax=Pseudoxanthomonas sp. X-1 TaxID=2571115 RepID=UPI00110AB627|nr:hypothetical protein [Pseudoxanthomonas sp. X-1]TMN16334.1 hypothetical protein FF950_18840 [Pseudoxanthomonas sp. X-1]UAY73142.1 hypothetical protein LAJ50_11480 [Pseudoxanthomonas sp. X-1]